MGNPAKNLLALAITVLMLVAMLFFFSHCASSAPGPVVETTQTDLDCPTVPDGYLSPENFTLSAEWEIVCVQQDDKYGFYWLFMKALKCREDGRTHALLVIPPGAKWPYIYNYLENGTLKFLVFKSATNAYVVDATITEANYNIVAKYYYHYFGVVVPQRKGV